MVFVCSVRVVDLDCGVLKGQPHPAASHYPNYAKQGACTPNDIMSAAFVVSPQPA